MRNGRDGFITYIGKRNTVISYRPDTREWHMTLVNNNNISAVTEAAMSSLAMGRHLWLVRGDAGCQRRETEMTLSLTTCGRDQFTCDSGLCISIDERQGGLECLLMN